ncbi:peptidase, M24 family, partial [Teladorsagia circumcincta]
MPEKKVLTADKELFLRHATVLYETWNKGEDGLGEVEALAVLVGQDEGAVQYSKSKAFQSDKDAANFAKLLGYIKNDAGNKVGHFAKDTFDSDFSHDWQKAFADVEKVDVSGAFVHIFAVKDDAELETCRSSAAATVNAWSYARKKFIEAIDQEKNYCTNLTRTLMVEPSKNLEDAYEALLATQMAVIEALKPGAKLSDVHALGVKTFREKCPSLADNLYKKDFGFVTGIEFREGGLTISPKCDEKVRAGMVFIVSAGVENLTNTKAKDDAGKNVT